MPAGIMPPHPLYVMYSLQMSLTWCVLNPVIHVASGLTRLMVSVGHPVIRVLKSNCLDYLFYHLLLSCSNYD